MKDFEISRRNGWYTVEYDEWHSTSTILVQAMWRCFRNIFRKEGK